MPTTKAPKPCGHCSTPSRRLYRIATDQSRRDNQANPWQLVCHQCWPTFKAHPGYTYGGTWTDRKRK